MVAFLIVCLSGCCTSARNELQGVTLSASSLGEAVFLNAAVAADHPAASQAGLDMLLAGGNAVDAAVATSFCLSVVRPYARGIGGGGFMLIYIPAEGRQPARTVALNYRESAPAGVGPYYYKELDESSSDAPSQFGVHAVAVPGTVRGLLYALEHYGTLDRATVMAPAIAAAENGFRVDAPFIGAVRDLEQTRREHPEIVATTQYMWETVCRGGELQPGELVRNPHKANALRLIAEYGDEAFYKGAIAEAIAGVVHKGGGALNASDLANYSMRIEAPLRGEFLGREVLTMPPPSSGGIAILQILGLIERKASERAIDASDGTPQLNAEYIHLLVEAMKHAFADRSRLLADDDFANVPIEQLLDAEYLDALAARIAMDEVQPSENYGSESMQPATSLEDSGTSHFCVIDSQGMAVACTETINLTFGSCVEVPGFGFVLNDEMDDFTTMPGTDGANAFGLMQSDRNAPEPGKRPLSSMSPTIVLKDGQVEFIAGASGGPRIITGTVQSLLNAMLFEMSPEEAVSAPRLHHQWSPGVLQFEIGRFDEYVVESMKQRGHEIGTRESVGIVQMIGVYPDGMQPACDPRGGGEPAGY